MAASRHDPCGVRRHRKSAEHEPCRLPDDQPVGLTPLGEALLDALRDDPRYRDILDDPWGDQGPPR